MFGCLAAWLTLVLAGMGMLIDFSSQPGDPGKPTTLWPNSTDLALSADGPTVVIGIHSECPCSNAAIADYERLLAKINSPVLTYLVVTTPSGMPSGTKENRLLERMRLLPGSTVVLDPDGNYTRAFGLATSGQTLLFQTNGALAFSGGITDGRGHEGSTLAAGELRHLIETGDAPRAIRPVFGCHLQNQFSPEAT